MHIKKTNNWNGSSYPNPSTYYNTNASANGTVYLYANQILDTSQQITLFMWNAERWTYFFILANIRGVYYYITYYGNDNTGGTTSQSTAEYGSAFTYQNNGFTRTGHTFTGWRLWDQWWNDYGFKTSGQSHGTWLTKTNLNAYAQWSANTYTIVYDGNTNTGGSTGNSTATYGVYFTFQYNGFTKTGYNFSSWHLHYAGYLGTYSQGQGYGNWDKTTNHVAYAQWTPATYTITYNGNQNTGGSTSNSTATYDSPFTFQNNGFTRTGYNFSSWHLYEGSTYIGTYGAGQGYGYWNKTLTNYTATAQWTPATSTITYNGNQNTGGTTSNNTATYNSPFTFQNNGFTRTGYFFFRWELYDTSNNLVAPYNAGSTHTWNIIGNYTAKAQWTINSYNAIFNNNGKGTGVTIIQNYNTIVTCPTIKSVGYAFGGWATSAASTAVNKAGNATFTLGAADENYYAIWTVNTNNTVYLSELQTVYGGGNPVGMSDYRAESGQTTANSTIALSANFKGKGPPP